MPVDDPPTAAARVHGESGAVMVEAALVVVILVALISGIVDISSLARTRIALERLASSSARVTAMGASPASTDLDVLEAVAGSLETMPGAVVRRVMVFRVESATGAPAPECEGLQPETASASGVAGLCNVYGPAHFAAMGSSVQPPMGCTPPSWEGAWCPAQRSRQQPAADHAGVLIEVEQRPLATGMFTSQVRVLTATAVVLLESEVP